MNGIREILVATDFSEPAEAAVEEALALASRLGAHVTVVHAWEVPIYGLPDGSLVATSAMVSEILDGADGALGAIVAKARERGFAIDARLVQGRPADVIQRIADETDANLVVVGTHGRKGLRRALLGSVAETLVRTSSRPILTMGPRATSAVFGGAAAGGAAPASR